MVMNTEDKLCSDIENELGPQGCSEYEVRQVKEKYRTLRFLLSAARGQRPLSGSDIRGPRRPSPSALASAVEGLRPCETWAAGSSRCASNTSVTTTTMATAQRRHNGSGRARCGTAELLMALTASRALHERAQ